MRRMSLRLRLSLLALNNEAGSAINPLRSKLSNSSAGRIVGTIACLEPVPLMTEYSRVMSAPHFPVFVDSSLDQRDVGLSNRSFSDGYGQHENYI